MFFLLVGILLISAYLFYLWYPIHRALKMADETILNHIPYEQHPDNPTMRILVAGDSTAAGVGADDPRNTIAGHLGQKFPQADMVNLGVSGYKLSDLIKVLSSQQTHYDLMLLQIGANDVTHFTPYDDIRKQIQEVLRFSTSLATKTIILTSGDMGRIELFRWPVNWIMSNRSRNARDIFVIEISKYPTATFVDLFYDLKKHKHEFDVTNFYSTDKFHLSGDGYAIYYHFVEKAL